MKSNNKRHSNKPETGKEIISEILWLYSQVFNTDAGQRVLEDLKIDLKHGENLYTKGIPVTDLYYQMGRQSVINDLLNKLKVTTK
nr:hypothetical protein BHI3_07590 [Bacteriovorax sp. HI3]